MKELSERISSIFALFISALKGDEQEFTTGSINKAIFMLSVPMIAEMLMESLFAVVDVYFVSKVSTNAVATVGLTESVLTLIYSIAIGLSIAVTAFVARRVGEKKYRRAADVAFQSIVLAIIVGLVLGVLGIVFAGDVLRLMGGEEELIAEGQNFTRIMYGGNLIIILLFLINGIFRGAGNAAIAMRSLWLANGLNIILDPILIFGWGPIPEMGIAGAAIATTIGRGTGVAYQLYHLFNGSSLIKITRRNIVMRWNTVTELIKVSAGGVGQMLVESASWIFMVRVVSIFGAEALAGYTIAFRVIIFTILPSWGMSNAAATLVGQNLGAGHPDRAESSVWRTAIFNTSFLVAVSIVFYLMAEHIIGFFTQEPLVMEQGIRALRIVCAGYLFFAFGMVVGQSFNGAGDTRTPMYISLFSFWAVQIPLAYVLAVSMEWGSSGVYVAIALSHSIYATLAVVLFKQGRWKKVQV